MSEYTVYRKHRYRVHLGRLGGKYILVNGCKKYIHTQTVQVGGSGLQSTTSGSQSASLATSQSSSLSAESVCEKTTTFVCIDLINDKSQLYLSIDQVDFLYKPVHLYLNPDNFNKNLDDVKQILSACMQNNANISIHSHSGILSTNVIKYLLNNRMILNNVTILVDVINKTDFIPNYEDINIINSIEWKNIDINFKLQLIHTGILQLNNESNRLIELELLQYRFKISVPPRTKNISDSWWYAYYKPKGCGFGRLKQFDGTCYFNAVLNGILLSENLSKYLLGLVSTRSFTPKQINYIINENNAYQNSCPTLPLVYLAKVLYRILCVKHKFTYKDGVRIWGEFAAETMQKSAETIVLKIIKTVYPQYTFHLTINKLTVLLNLYHHMNGDYDNLTLFITENPEFLQLLEQSVEDNDHLMKMIEAWEKKSTSSIIYTRNVLGDGGYPEKAMLNLLESVLPYEKYLDGELSVINNWLSYLKINEYPDILIQKLKPNTEHNFTREMLFVDQHYSLEAMFISLFGTTTGHVIVAGFCQDIGYIYDSGHNKYLTIDWLNKTYEEIFNIIRQTFGYYTYNTIVFSGVFIKQSIINNLPKVCAPQFMNQMQQTNQ
jgi:hypothetical protein